MSFAARSILSRHGAYWQHQLRQLDKLAILSWACHQRWPPRYCLPLRNACHVVSHNARLLYQGACANAIAAKGAPFANWISCSIADVATASRLTVDPSACVT
ncbi:hypothetical protein [Psychrobacter immobilis]|uniref:hypothetical protein n=1 Tax=Psychrobacter immobilis TaxID=498 RepID=UPI001D12A689|nr:hypothetical protein [Psychrobacter immobilis]